MIKIDNYTFKNKLEVEAAPKAKELINEFYETAHPNLTEYNKKHYANALKHAIVLGYEKGVYIYDDDNELVGLALYHVQLENPTNVCIDAISFDKTVRKTYAGVYEEHGPSVLLKAVIKIISKVAKKNNKDTLILCLNDEILYLENNFNDLGFDKTSHLELNLNTNLYKKTVK
ncbi:MAG: hypothetical protein J5892_03770 [Bacilli bacterium]|nr:hypothetical protein [Bacilli bacterium]